MDQGMVTRPDLLLLKDTTVCHLQEDTTNITIREETMHEMTEGIVGLPRGVDRGLGSWTCSSRVPIGMWSQPLLLF